MNKKAQTQDETQSIHPHIVRLVVGRSGGGTRRKGRNPLGRSEEVVDDQDDIDFEDIDDFEDVENGEDGERRALHAYRLLHARSSFQSYYNRATRQHERPSSSVSWDPYHCCHNGYKVVCFNYKFRDMCRPHDQIRDVRITPKTFSVDRDGGGSSCTLECGERYVRLASIRTCPDRDEPRVSFDIVCMN